jgi:hypothetical protein
MDGKSRVFGSVILRRFQIGRWRLHCMDGQIVLDSRRYLGDLNGLRFSE